MGLVALSRKVHGEAFEITERAVSQSALVSRTQDDAGCLVGLECFLPARCAQIVCTRMRRPLTIVVLMMRCRLRTVTNAQSNIPFASSIDLRAGRIDDGRPPHQGGTDEVGAHHQCVRRASRLMKRREYWIARSSRFSGGSASSAPQWLKAVASWCRRSVRTALAGSIRGQPGTPRRLACDSRGRFGSLLAR